MKTSTLFVRVIIFYFVASAILLATYAFWHYHRPISKQPEFRYCERQPGANDTQQLAPQKQTKKLAVIVPFRDREEHLKIFAPYMHHYLKSFGHDPDRGLAKIFVVEQSPGRKFAKSVLFNHGAKIAIEEGYDYLALHDIDHLPVGVVDKKLKENETPVDLYAFPQGRPMHLSTCSEVYGYKLNYKNYVGGVIIISAAQMLRTNGFNDYFEGWGGEDDDFRKRLVDSGVGMVQRFNPHCISRFINLKHVQRDKSNLKLNKSQLRQYHRLDYKKNGFNTLAQHPAKVKRRTETRYYDLIYVEYAGNSTISLENQFDNVL